MKAVIVCVSVSHGNTRRIADTMAQVLGAKVVSPDQVSAAELAEADLVGFGSGVFYAAMHPDLHQLIRALPVGRRRAFVFATSGFPEFPFKPFSRPVVRLLEDRGYEVCGNFSCRAFDTWAPLKPIGGVNKQRPNATDVAAARAFAEQVRDRCSAPRD